MTLALLVSLDRYDWTWRPVLVRGTYSRSVAWLCFEGRVAW